MSKYMENNGINPEQLMDLREVSYERVSLDARDGSEGYQVVLDFFL